MPPNVSVAAMMLSSPTASPPNDVSVNRSNLEGDNNDTGNEEEENLYKNMLRSTLGWNSTLEGLEYLLDDEGERDEGDNDPSDAEEGEEDEESDNTEPGSAAPSVRASQQQRLRQNIHSEHENNTAKSEQDSGKRKLHPLHQNQFSTSDSQPHKQQQVTPQQQSPLVQDWRTRVQNATQQQQKQLQHQLAALQEKQQRTSPKSKSRSRTPKTPSSSSFKERAKFEDSVVKTPKTVRFADGPSHSYSSSYRRSSERQKVLGTPKVAPSTTTISPRQQPKVPSVSTPAPVRMRESKIPSLFQTPSPATTTTPTSNVSISSQKATPVATPIEISKQTLHEVSLRNEILEESWKKQQAQNKDLQHQLDILQQNYQEEQQLWEKEKMRLLSPRQLQSVEEQLAQERDRRMELQTKVIQLNKELEQARLVPTPRLETLHQLQQQLRQQENEHSEEITRLKRDHALELENLKHKHQEELNLHESELRRALQDTTLELEEALHRTVELQQQQLQHPRRLVHDQGDDGWQSKYQKLEIEYEQRLDEWKSKYETMQRQLEEQRRKEHQGINQRHTNGQGQHSGKGEAEAEAYIAGVQTNDRSSVDFEDFVAEIERNHGSELEELERQLQDATHLDRSGLNSSSSSSLDLSIGGGDEKIEADSSSESIIHSGVESPLKLIPTREDDSGVILSPILPQESTPIGRRGTSRIRLSEGDSGGTDIPESPPTPKIDLLIDELGAMDQERTILLEQMSRYPGDEDDDNSTLLENREGLSLSGATNSSSRNCNNSNNKNKSESEMLDATLELLYRMKELVTSPKERMMSRVTTEEDSSVLEQLEVLSEMLGESERLEESLLLVGEHEGGGVSETSLVEVRDDDGRQEGEVRPKGGAGAGEGEGSLAEWINLAGELRRQVEFLEHDREEVVRITGMLMEQARESHKVELEVAAASGRRRGYEAARATARIQMQRLMHSLCSKCQERILYSG